jgi:prepilin-type N-terminal cleavage/methylation domain-containing protein/prepilin-type processing-associated H-X9-DG protein
MKRRRERAFTLLELMVVVAIIGILIALLMPGVSSAWDMARMTQCQSNLADLFKAQMSWIADRDATSEGTLNAGWAGTLQMYLEGKGSQLRCPSALILSTGAGGGGTGGGGGMPPSTVGDDFAVGADDIILQQPDITLDDVTIGVLDASRNLLYEIPLAPSPYWSWFQSWLLADGRTHIGANLDNYFPKDSLGHYTDEDFYFTVEFRGSAPSKVTIGPCDGSANTGLGKWSDMRVAHKPIWGGEVFGNMFAQGHHGEVVDLEREMEKNGMLSPSARVRKKAFACWTILAASKGTLGATSYGISRGSYQVAQNTYVPRCDPKLFFILDYPRAVADYTAINDTPPDTPFWDLIFIDPAPPEGWTPPTGLEGRTWEEVQALRHFGKANVLFCDGHIESLGPEDLGATNPLWRFAGR